MLSIGHVGIAALVLAAFASVASAQSPGQRSERDSLWNGTLIGLGVGVGSVLVLDAVFCDNGFGGCDTPWAAYVTLGGIGAGAGAGIDFLIGRHSHAPATRLRWSPFVGRTRKGVIVTLTLPRSGAPHQSNTNGLTRAGSTTSPGRETRWPR